MNRKPPNAGKGRPKGSVNRVTADVKSMVLEALHHGGGAEWLCMQMLDNPKAFMSLLGRVLPLQVTGNAGAPIEVSVNKTSITDDTQRLARILQIMAAARGRLERQGGAAPKDE